MTSLLEQDDQLPILDPNKDYYAELVGEDKKFKDNQSLAKGKYEADLYVKTLERRMDELRNDYTGLKSEYESRANLQELIDQLKQQKLPDNTQKPEVKDTQQPTINSKDIESLVSSKIQEHKVSEKQSENFNIVKEKLKERFGNNYQDVVKEQVDKLGLTIADVDALAKKSPTAALKALGLDQPAKQETFQAPPRGTQRSDSFKPSGTQKRTWSYYQELKKKNPKVYYDPKISVQMQKDYIELGAEFEDGDFSIYN